MLVPLGWQILIAGLRSSSSASALLSRSVVRNWRGVLDPAYPEARPCDSPDCCLRSGTGRPRAGASDRSYLDVDCCDSLTFGDIRSRRSRPHGGVRRGLEPVSFYVSAA